jgi:hypothetical protein
MQPFGATVVIILSASLAHINSVDASFDACSLVVASLYVLYSL